MKFRRLLSILVIFALLLSLAVPAIAEEEPKVGYEIYGISISNGYRLAIYAYGEGLYGGRLAVKFDDNKLQLRSSRLSSLIMGSGISYTAEGMEETKLLSNQNGTACFGWWSGALDASEGAFIAAIDFNFVNDVTLDDIDETTFRLMAVENGKFGVYTSAAYLIARGTETIAEYSYLDQNASPISILYTYLGYDKPATDGREVTFTIKNNLNEPLPAVLKMGGRTYTADENGKLTLRLLDGDYLYEASCEGYGDKKGRLTVSEDGEVNIVLVNDETLVAEAKETLEIGYSGDDTAKSVTMNISLLKLTDTGVTVTWTSSEPNVVTTDGIVFRRDYDSVKVKLTAKLSRGAVSDTKTFNINVMPRYERTSDGQTPTIQKNFTDLGKVAWAEDSIYKLAAAGIIKGTTDTTFSPTSGIKRGDFILLLVRMMDIDIEPGEAFDDVRPGSYYEDAIRMARAAGITNGIGGNKFAPTKTITRQEMIVLTLRAVEKMGYVTLKDEKADLSEFKDVGKIANYAVNDMAKAVANGLIIGSGGNLTPRSTANRAQAAVFLARIYDLHNAQ